MNTNATMPATPRQTFALFCATGQDWRPMKLTMKQASDMISAVKTLNNKPAALAICTDIYGGQLPPPPAGIVVKQINNFAAIWDEAHEAGMKAYNAYNGGWYPCGFASVILKSGISAFAKWCRKNKQTSKFYYGGEQIWVHGATQSMDQKADYAAAFAAVLQKHGIECRVHTAID